MKELYVASCCRTAVGAFQGSLSNTPAAELGAVVVKAALERAGLPCHPGWRCRRGGVRRH